MFGGDVITVIRAAGHSADGDPTGTAAEVDVEGCYVQPRSSPGGGGSSTETLGGRDTVVTGLIAFVPAGADIRATDRIRWKGDLYEVDGDDADWSTPDGEQHHLEISLQRVKG